MLFTSYCLIYLLSSTNAYTIKSERRSNFEATFGATPSPFQINVNPQFIAETKLKATLTRYTVDANVSAWYDGPPRENVTTVRDYWVNQYDWFSVQEGLNKQFTQFTTTVFANESSTYEDPIPLHFVHHVSPRADAIPLLFLHGWPGSFMEVGPIIQGLTHPPSSAMPAFHVVAPSIPGFGFSPAPTSPGLNFQVAAVAYNELMIQLGYRKYVVQGGDLGAITSHFLAGTFPENVVSVHSNFWLVQPNATDIERFNNGLTTHDENTTIENLSNFSHELSGFTHIQEAMPLEAATALTDSPVGYAMWIFPLLHFGVDVYEWSAEEVITWSMMHYIQGPFGAMRMYKEAAEEGVFLGFAFSDAPYLPNVFPFVKQPVAISQFPKDFWFGTPLDWARRTGNVVERIVHDKGGHFAALERPQDLINDMRNFWGNETLSGTSIFHD